MQVLKRVIFPILIIFLCQGAGFCVEKATFLDVEGLEISCGLGAANLPKSHPGSSSEIKFDFPVSPDVKLSLGYSNSSSGYSTYNWSLFGSSSTSYQSLLVQGPFIGISVPLHLEDLIQPATSKNNYYIDSQGIHPTISLPLVDDFVKGITESVFDPSRGRAEVGLRFDYLSAQQVSGEDHVNSSYNDLNSSLNGNGYKGSILIEGSTGLKFNDRLLFNCLFSLNYYNLSLNGKSTLGSETSSSSRSINGLGYSYSFGLTYQI